MRRVVPLFLAWALVVLPGCNPVAQPSDPERARATLCEALDAWQKGETPEAFRGRSRITAVESRWQGGSRLLGYEMTGDGEASGFDVQFKAKLSLQSAGGKKTEERAVYNVSTSPALVVVRAEGS